VKVENGALLGASHNILYMWKNYFQWLLNLRSVSDVRQLEIHTAEPLVPSPFEGEIAILKLKKYKFPVSDQILAEVIKKNCLY
jgi:hypothetical protein